MATTYRDEKFAGEIQDKIREVIEDGVYEDGYLLGMAGGVRRIETYEEAMVLTQDKGLVIKFEDGSEAQITIIAARPAEQDRNT